MAASLATAASAHAVERAGCIEVTAASPAHFDGDADQEPADADTGQPHHHGTCHGHHVAAPSAAGQPLAHSRSAVLLPIGPSAAMMGTPADPALRPPKT